MYYIVFGIDAEAWTTRHIVNVAFLENTFNYLKEQLKHRGYLYLNDIYETLGVKWDPNKVNLCFRDEHDIDFEIVKVETLDYLIGIKHPELEAL